MDFLQPYSSTVLVMGLTGLLLIIQLSISDIANIICKQTPGFSIQEDHDQLQFRAYRAFANSNETIGALIVLIMFSIASSADASWVNTSAIIYFVSRLLHALCYYFNLKLLRSIAFVGVFIGLIGLFIAGIKVWL